MLHQSRARGRLGLFGLSAAATLALWAGAASPDAAQAAPCPIPSYGIDGSKTLTIEGVAPCDSAPEDIAVYCQASTVQFTYDVNGVPQGPFDTAIACSLPVGVNVLGKGDDDVIDLSRVSAGNGFTGISQLNVIDGGYGNDTLIGGPAADAVIGGLGNDIVLVRNGTGDSVDCGDGTDAVQSDQAGVDTLVGCEIQDLLPTPAVTPPPVVAGPTGRRAAAVKRCRQRHRPGRARAKCLRHAHTLPV